MVVTKTVRHIVRSMRARDVRQSTRPATSKGADLRLMRELNRLLILNGVRVSGPITRVAVAHRTGLSRTTVSSIVDELLADNLLFEGKTVEAAPTGVGARPCCTSTPTPGMSSAWTWAAAISRCC